MILSYPLGLRSAPKIFTAVADKLQWILSNRGVGPPLHYLDDFLIVGLPQFSQCRESLQLAVAVCPELGAPLASDKLVGPAQKLQFLGITLDTESLELHLPVEKLVVSNWRGRRSCTKRELMHLENQVVVPFRQQEIGSTGCGMVCGRMSTSQSKNSFISNSLCSMSAGERQCIAFVTMLLW